MIREARDDKAAQERYLDPLREWFKNGTFAPKTVAAAYMRGILPVKKDGSQSAISDFREFSMLFPGEYAKFTGFTETIPLLCRRMLEKYFLSGSIMMKRRERMAE